MPSANQAASRLEQQLRESALRGNVARVQELIAAGATTNAAYSGGEGEPRFVTLLHSLCGLPEGAPGGLGVMDLLLQARASVNPRSSDGSTPLARACEMKNLGAARLLLEWKADVRPCDDQGYDSLLRAIAQGPSARASSTPRRQAQKDDPRVGSYTSSLVHIEPTSIDCSNPNEAGAIPDFGDDPVEAPGCTEGSVSAQLVQLLLETGLSAQLAEVEPGICASLRRPSLRGRRWLESPDREAEFPYENCCLGTSKITVKEKATRRVPPLLLAVQHQNPEAAAALLRAGVRAEGLHEAVRSGSPELVQVLLDAKADPLAVDECGDSPMDLALQMNEDSAMMDALREATRHFNSGRGDNDWTTNSNAASPVHGVRRAKTHELPSTLARMKSGSKGRRTSLELMREALDGRPQPSRGRCRQGVWRLSNCCLATLERCSARTRPAAQDLCRRCRSMYMSHAFQGIMFAALIGALFIPDMWAVLAFRSGTLLDTILLLLLAVFVLELAVQAFGLGRVYLTSFFFLTDVIGACSLLLDLSVVRAISSGTGIGDNAVIMRAARTARLGARAGRFTKLMKLLRFMPGLSQSPKGAGTAKVLTSILVTKLSTHVSSLIIVLVIVLPLFGLIAYPEQDWAMKLWVDHLAEAVEDGAPAQEVDEMIRDFRTSFRDRNYQPHSIRRWSSSSEDGILWRSHSKILPSDECKVSAGSIIVIFDFAGENRAEAGSNLALICFTILLMVAFSLMISNSVSRIALHPLEKILSKVRTLGSTLCRNAETMQKQLVRSSAGLETAGDWPANEAEQGGETALLECVVRKLAVLSEITMGKSRPNDLEALEYLGESPVCSAKLKSMSSWEERSLHPGWERGCSAEDPDGRATLACCSWDFNPRDFNLAESCSLCTNMLEYSLGKLLGDDQDVQGLLSAFVLAAAAGYQKGPQYHNWSHALDVTHVLFMVVHQCSKSNLISWLEESALLVSAVCHDVAHPGVTNDFLVQTSSDLAIRYNDTSPLENMHCARLFEIVTHPQTAIFSSLTAEQFKEVRSVCIEAILHTDNAHHRGLVQRLQMFGEVHSELLGRAQEFHARGQPSSEAQEEDAAHHQQELWPPGELLEAMWDPEWRTSIRNSLLHFADISNPVRPFKICRQWAVAVLEEFFAQGDLEKQRGLPVHPLNDRERTNLPFSQISFIDFFVAPLVFSTVRLLAPLEQLAEQLVANTRYWADEWTAEVGPPEEAAQNVAARIRRLEERAAALAPRPSSASAMTKVGSIRRASLEFKKDRMGNATERRSSGTLAAVRRSKTSSFSLGS